MCREQRTVISLAASCLHWQREELVGIRTPEFRARVAQSWANVCPGMLACMLESIGSCRSVEVEVDRMLRPAASEVAAAAARKTLIEPHEAKDGSPATCWKSRHDDTGKALWIRLNSVAPWRVSGRCGTGCPGACVEERPSAGHCRCLWPAKMKMDSHRGHTSRCPHILRDARCWCCFQGGDFFY